MRRHLLGRLAVATLIVVALVVWLVLAPSLSSPPRSDGAPTITIETPTGATP